MFLLFKTIIIVLTIDYILHNFYLKNYNIIVSNDIYKYRIILRTILWLFISFSISQNMWIQDEVIHYFIYASILSIIIYIIEKIYFCTYNNYCMSFICADLVISTIISNIVVFISIYLLKD